MKDEGKESGKLGKPRKPRRGARGRAEGPQGSVRDPKPRKVEELGQRKQEREGKLVGGKEGEGWGWRVVRFGIGLCGGWGRNSWAEDEGVRREEMGIGKEWAKRRVRVIGLRRR